MISRTRATIVHLSDLHLRSAPDKGNFYDELEDAGVRAEQLISYVDKKYRDAHVVVTGDITDSGTPEARAEALRILSPMFLRERLSVVPGNHDCGTLGNYYIEERWRAFCACFRPLWGDRVGFPWVKHVGPLAIVGLDSNVKSHGDFWATGNLGQQQLSELDRILGGLPPFKIPVVLLHHHPYDTNGLTELVDAKALRTCLSARLKGRSGVVLYGHKHGSTVHRRSGVTYYQAPSSIVINRARLRFRVLSVGFDGIKESWDGCPASR